MIYTIIYNLYMIFKSVYKFIYIYIKHTIDFYIQRKKKLKEKLPIFLGGGRKPNIHCKSCKGQDQQNCVILGEAGGGAGLCWKQSRDQEI